MAGGLGEPIVDPVVFAPAPPIAVAGNWTGAYVGLQVGYVDVGSSGGGLDGDGAIGGVHGGYRYDFGRGVIGAEIDYDAAGVELGDGLGELEGVGRFKLQAGYDAGRALIYGTAGYARAEASVAGENLTGEGYFYGVGADYALTPRITLGGEILKHDFADFDNSGVGLDATTVKAKVSLRF